MISVPKVRRLVRKNVQAVRIDQSCEIPLNTIKLSSEPASLISSPQPLPTVDFVVLTRFRQTVLDELVNLEELSLSHGQNLRQRWFFSHGLGQRILDDFKHYLKSRDIVQQIVEPLWCIFCCLKDV